jgi:hypothetical protein
MSDFSAKIGTVPTDAEKLEIIKECAHRMMESYACELGMAGELSRWRAIWSLCAAKPPSDPSDDPPIPAVGIAYDLFDPDLLHALEETRACTRQLWEQYGNRLDLENLVQAREKARQAYNARLQAEDKDK